MGNAERIGWAAGGGALAAFGIATAIAKRSWMHAGLGLLGAALIRRGAAGEQGLSGLKAPGRVRLSRVITIQDKTPEEVYAFWRNLENLPRVLGSLQSVEEIDSRRSHWKARGPAGRPVEWDAEITNDRGGRVIEWKSLAGSDIDIAGTVLFRRKRGRGTKVHLTVEYTTPGGAIGEALGRMLGAVPEREIDAGLEQLRGAMEGA